MPEEIPENNAEGDRRLDEIRSLQDSTIKGRANHLREVLKTSHCPIDIFVKSNKKPENLFYIDKSLSKEDIEKRMACLKEVFEKFKALPSKEKDKLEEEILGSFGVENISVDAQAKMDSIYNNLPKDQKPHGAENQNMIYDKDGEKEVLKTTMERHNLDFLSIIKLMYMMHAIELRISHAPKETPGLPVDVETEVSFKEILIYKDAKGNYKRLVRQNFAKGTRIKDLPQEVKDDDLEFKEAFAEFLRRVESMKETDGVVLDISDSEAGMKEARGNVINTGNVFVEIDKSGKVPKYKFTIIDPDVFDTDWGKHKFFPSEHIRKKGVRGFMDALKIGGINHARDLLVRDWQDRHTKHEMAQTIEKQKHKYTANEDLSDEDFNALEV